MKNKMLIEIFFIKIYRNRCNFANNIYFQIAIQLDFVDTQLSTKSIFIPHVTVKAKVLCRGRRWYVKEIITATAMSAKHRSRFLWLVTSQYE